MKINFNIITFLIFSFINWFSSEAQINFIEHTIDDNVRGLGGITACDIDDDTDMDVLGASLQDNQIILWRNDGGSPIIWTKIIIGNNIFSAHSVQAADLDGDDTLDVIGAAYAGTPGIPWWRNDGGNPINWTKITVAHGFTNAHEIYTHDLDQDGDIDVLGASSDLNRVAWWRNNGGSPISWTEQIFTSNATLAKSVHVGDFDNNDTLDVVAASILDNKIRWWRNEGGNPIQWIEYNLATFYGVHRVQAVDLDADGDDDVLAAAYLGHEIAWWQNNGGNPITWTKRSIATGFINACIAYAIDLDNDGDLDVIATGQGLNQIAWWRNDGGNPITWTKFIITNNFTRPWPLYACDLDGDSDHDVIVGSSHDGNNKINWWENNGVVNTIEISDKVGGIVLHQNHPNPFNPVTTIYYAVPNITHIQIIIYDALGRHVRNLFQGFQTAGDKKLKWYGKNDFGENVNSGVYFYQLTTPEFNQVKKLILIR